MHHHYTGECSVNSVAKILQQAFEKQIRINGVIMIGVLVSKAPWLAQEAKSDAPKRLGEQLTFALENNSALQIQYRPPQYTSPQTFSLSKKYSIEDLGATYVGADPDFCYEATGIRVFQIKEL